MKEGNEETSRKRLSENEDKQSNKKIKKKQNQEKSLAPSSSERKKYSISQVNFFFALKGKIS